MTTTPETLAHGWQLHQAGNVAAAEEIYRGVLASHPNDSTAWCYLGLACHDRDRLDEAVAAYRNAIRIRPNFPIAYNNLGNTLRMQRRLDESIACLDAALKLKPDYVNAYKNKGTALAWAGRLDEAVQSYQQALDHGPEDAETHKNLGVIRLLQGRFEEGWREYEWWRKMHRTFRPVTGQPAWDGSPLDGKTILLVGEQGFGDTIHFIRYAAVLKQRFDCRVVALCPKPLLPLLKSFQAIDELVPTGSNPPAFDTYVPLLSIPGIFNDNLDTFPADVPYLFPDDRLVEKWKAELAGYGGLKIGIAWQGNPGYEADCFRSVPLAEFAPLGKLSGIRLLSLQKGAGVEQLDALAGCLDVVDWGDRLDRDSGPFMDTAAILKNLDLVITPDMALAHVAGALGVPVWLVLSYVPHWPWQLEREDTPWYPTMRLFRQPEMDDWPSVFRRIAEELKVQHPATVAAKRPEQYHVASSGFNRLARTRHGLMLYNRHDVYVGRSLDRYGEYSEGETDLFRQVVRPGQVVVEAGANVGAHTLALSKLVGDKGAVYAFEPQRVLFQTLCANMALNSRTNVHCRCEAVGQRPDWIFVPALNFDVENNFAGLGLGEYQSGEKTPVATVDGLELPRCDLLKVDVEGMELSVLKGAAKTIEQFRPILYVENDRQDRSASLIEYITSLGYHLYWHLPRLFNPANYFGNPRNEFANIVSANMLCVHASVKTSISGLRPIEGP
ncbi:MAG TPA: FkbM family methyltransferase [Thermoguttaceae bacterium]|nr:FkbM family methyltransferase [Thermoguttaceae bacterium]